ncbi:MAG: EamA/RhaT family transporter [Chloroflexi bacterium]|nr:EamA/RhaT family transporter [Chloroflexota bacterium]
MKIIPLTIVILDTTFKLISKGTVYWNLDSAGNSEIIPCCFVPQAPATRNLSLIHSKVVRNYMAIPVTSTETVMHRDTQGLILIVLAATAFSSQAIFAKFAFAHGMNPLSLMTWRFGLAGVILGIILFFQSRLRPADYRPTFSLRPGSWLGLIFLGAVLYFLQSLAFFTSLTLIPAGTAVLLLYFNPILVSLMAVLFFHEKFDISKLVALILAFAGCTLVLGVTGTPDLAAPNPAGVALALLSALVYAIYIITGTRLTRGIPAPLASSIIMIAAWVSYAAVAVVRRQLIVPSDLLGWEVVLGVVFCTIVAVTTFFAGLERIGPSRAAIISNVEPVATVSLAALILGEAITPGQIVGGAMILAAVIILQLKR